MIRRRDVAVLLAMLALAGALYALLRPGGGGGAPNRVVVTIDGVQVFAAPLGAKGLYPLQSGGPQLNVLEVLGDGAVRMVQANCPDQWCIRKGMLSDPGDFIACLPHHLVVRLQGENLSPDGPDVVIQ
ncbi:MAG: NusG domain II-containing protein [Oscillospiraceae bacterium]|jgi:hypothetical protein|nr:NusG domain II-containing protein [Oscillospiraceae bacterium]